MTNSPDYIQIPLENLNLDPRNPRLPKSLIDKGASENDIIEFMLLDASLIELMMAIGENGFFPGEQLLVVKNSNNSYRVIEGNRRLSALKLLSDPSLTTVQTLKVQKAFEEAKFKPNLIPALVFADDTQIHNYLGYRHITGIKEWKLLEKARYLSGLRNENFNDETIQDASRAIAKIIGSSLDYVRRILVGFDIYKRIEDERFYRIRDLDDTSFHFNYIADSLNKNNIREFLGVDVLLINPLENINNTHVKTWTKWLFEKNDQNKTRLIGTSGDLSKLNKILGNETAKSSFMDGADLERAYDLTEDLEAIFSESISKSIKYLEQADNIVHRITTFSPNVSDDLQSLRRLAIKIKTTIDSTEDDKF